MGGGELERVEHRVACRAVSRLYVRASLAYALALLDSDSRLAAVR